MWLTDKIPALIWAAEGLATMMPTYGGECNSVRCQLSQGYQFREAGRMWRENNLRLASLAQGDTSPPPSCGISTGAGRKQAAPHRCTSQPMYQGPLTFFLITASPGNCLLMKPMQWWGSCLSPKHTPILLLFVNSGTNC